MTKPHGNKGNRNAAKAPERRISTGPAITIRGVPERGLYAKAASKQGIKLAEWCRAALREKYDREEAASHSLSRLTRHAASILARKALMEFATDFAKSELAGVENPIPLNNLIGRFSRGASEAIRIALESVQEPGEEPPIDGQRQPLEAPDRSPAGE